MLKPRLALAMIVKNEAAHLARCLDRIRPWVDHMLVLDTGSSDDTIAIAEHAGAEVRHFAWCDDFAAARNAALDAVADYDWVLVLDADETIVAGGEILRRFIADLEPCLGRIAIRSTFRQENGEIQTSVSRISRLLPRGVRYRGRIHEQIAATLPHIDTGVVVEHSGYLDTDKSGRNIPLLQAELVGSPQDAALHYLLGREWQAIRRHDEARQHFTESYRLCLGRYTWESDLVVRFLQTLKACEAFDEAVAVASAEQERQQHNADFFFVLADTLLDLFIRQPPENPAEVAMVEQCWQRCLELGDSHAEVEGRGSYLAAYNLGAFAEVWNDVPKARHWYGMAATQGYAPASERLAGLKEVE
ncbi:glycosyltransferase family 2 protein [Crenobacter sp. SG2305]|uniref:glycosyltransferase n=1 Tax=Crenobacter oryzisoli TaxID=3056844 RepID=UPI0025AA6ABD|nr:glycosyltransferase [Crenobacter sp. SG2305]MDN0082978.1 glycosyltransferase family 2 protein [Crenobacter sp. SG2305]